jgi:hypothetical protein
MKQNIGFLALVSLLFASSIALACGDDEKDFRPLFNGNDLTGKMSVD